MGKKNKINKEEKIVTMVQSNLVIKSTGITSSRYNKVIFPDPSPCVSLHLSPDTTRSQHKEAISLVPRTSS